MERRLKGFCYVSVRDLWTQKMFANITGGALIAPVTPDPVFAFNYNVTGLVRSREETLQHFRLSERYLLLSFSNMVTVSQPWIDEFASKAAAKGYNCVMLPFADKMSFGRLPDSINLPLSPLDWYAIIKYSSGYIGHNMHPIIVSIHNNVPFFSFDNYGQRHLNGLLSDDSSSKIRHILSHGGLEKYRISCLPHFFNAPPPDFVLDKILTFDKERELKFAEAYNAKYLEMMLNIEKSINHA